MTSKAVLLGGYAMDSSDEDEKIPCPNSAEHQSLADDYVLHYATRSELKAHRGVCAACFEKFRKHNLGALSGRRETPSEFHRRRSHDVQHDHVGFGDDHEILGVEDFNFNEVDQLLGNVNSEPETVRQQVAEAVSKILVTCWLGGSGKPTSATAAMQRFSAICAGILPSITARSFQELANELGVTRAAMSKHVVSLQQLLNVKFNSSRSPEARRSMRNARLINPVGRNNGSRKAKMAHPTPGKESFEPKPTNGSDRTPSSPHA